ncbi:MAG: hypothetical protein AAF226_06265, partial [Verrucomicrobiota bacterium]
QYTMIPEADLSLVLGEVSRNIERGFGNSQISVILTKASRLAEGDFWCTEFHVRAFGRGTAFQVVTCRMDSDHIGIIFEADSALSFTIGTIVAKYEIIPEAEGEDSSRDDDNDADFLPS